MVFYKNVSDLSEKIIKISKDDKLRKKLVEKEETNISNISILI